MKELLTPSLLTLLYHEVTDNPTDSGFQNKGNLPYIHTVKGFVETVNKGKEFLFTSKLISEIDFSKDEKHLLYTFDDGGISALKSSELLEEQGCKGHYFITTYYIDQPLFLSKQDILTLAHNGHSIGSHSHTHPMIFRSLTYQKMLEEWKTSKSILEDLLGKQINSCSVPGGDVDEKTYDSAIEAGFKYIFNSEPTTAIYQKHSSYIIGRFALKNTTSLQTVTNILSYKNHKELQRNRNLKRIVKKLIFPIHSFIQNKKNI